MIIRIPAVAVPPSANTIYLAIGARRGKTKAYKRWLNTAIFECGRVLGADDPTRSNETMVPAKAAYGVKIAAGIDRRRDLDNLIKPTLDMLVKAMIVPDDRWCDFVEARRESPRNNQMSIIIAFNERDEDVAGVM